MPGFLLRPGSTARMYARRSVHRTERLPVWNRQSLRICYFTMFRCITVCVFACFLHTRRRNDGVYTAPTIRCRPGPGGPPLVTAGYPSARTGKMRVIICILPCSLGVSRRAIKCKPGCVTYRVLGRSGNSARERGVASGCLCGARDRRLAAVWMMLRAGAASVKRVAPLSAQDCATRF